MGPKAQGPGPWALDLRSGAKNLGGWVLHFSKSSAACAGLWAAETLHGIASLPNYFEYIHIYIYIYIYI